MTKNRTPTPVYLDHGMHPGLEVKGLIPVREVWILEGSPCQSSPTSPHSLSTILASYDLFISLEADSSYSATVQSQKATAFWLCRSCLSHDAGSQGVGFALLISGHLHLSLETLANSEPTPGQRTELTYIMYIWLMLLVGSWLDVSVGFTTCQRKLFYLRWTPVWDRRQFVNIAQNALRAAVVWNFALVYRLWHVRNPGMHPRPL